MQAAGGIDEVKSVEAASQKIFAAMKRRFGASYLFGISRSSDYTVVGYTLSKDQGTGGHRVFRTDLSSDEPVIEDLDPSRMLVRRFYGLSPEAWLDRDRTKYETFLKCVPDRKITVRLRGEKPPVVKTAIAGKLCNIVNAHVDMVFSPLTGVPDVRSITLVGYHTGDGKIYSEQIIPDLESVDTGSLFREYMSEKISTTTTRGAKTG